uniref:Sleeping Beauty transposase HTH domain-containing protein n=1 Tax=Haplochromis burtoni TaxID=8153 RepID=A0A3Q2WVS9_HAPBU
MRIREQHDFREATVAAHQTGKGYKVYSTQFEVHHSTVRKIIHKWKTFKTSDCAMLRETAKDPRATCLS